MEHLSLKIQRQLDDNLLVSSVGYWVIRKVQFHVVCVLFLITTIILAPKQ